MKLKALATVPGAFVTGLVGTMAYYAFWAGLSRAYPNPTRATALFVYVVFILVPFLVFVIGIDAERWHRDYDAVRDGASVDVRGIVMRWVVYWVGYKMAYVFTLSLAN